MLMLQFLNDTSYFTLDQPAYYSNIASKISYSNLIFYQKLIQFLGCHRPSLPPPPPRHKHHGTKYICTIADMTNIFDNYNETGMSSLQFQRSSASELRSCYLGILSVGIICMC